MSAQELNGAKVTLSMHDATVEDFANEVAKQTGLNVKFADDDVRRLRVCPLMYAISQFQFVTELGKPVPTLIYR